MLPYILYRSTIYKSWDEHDFSWSMVIPTEPDRRHQKTNVEPLVTSGDHRPIINQSSPNHSMNHVDNHQPIINQQLTKPTILKQNKEHIASESLQSLEFRALSEFCEVFTCYYHGFCMFYPLWFHHRGHVGDTSLNVSWHQFSADVELRGAPRCRGIPGVGAGRWRRAAGCFQILNVFNGLRIGTELYNDIFI